jgi:hypothetical protein
MRRGFMIGCMGLILLSGCRRAMDRELPPGYTIVDGSLIECQILVAAEGAETITPLPLTDDIRSFRLQLREKFRKTLAQGDGKKSPSLTVLVTLHDKVPKLLQDRAKGKFGEHIAADLTFTLRCGPFYLQKTDEGKSIIFQIEHDGSSQLQASTTGDIDSLLDQFVDTLPDRISTAYAGSNDSLAQRLKDEGASR